MDLFFLISAKIGLESTQTSAFNQKKVIKLLISQIYSSSRCKIKLTPKSRLRSAGDQEAKMIGICCDVPNACIKLDVKKIAMPIKTPVMINKNAEPERGSLIATPAAIKTIAANIKGRASKTW